MFEIIFGLYILLFPLLLVLAQVVPISYRQTIKAFRTTIQVSIIAYSLFLIRQLIGLYQLTRLFKMNQSQKDYFGTSMLEMSLMVVLPFLFLIKKIRNGYILGILLWLIFMHAQMQKELLFIGAGVMLLNAVFFYISLLTAIYALLWLLNQSSSSNPSID